MKSLRLPILLYLTVGFALYSEARSLALDTARQFDNSYSYTGNNPINSVDLNGLWGEKVDRSIAYIQIYHPEFLTKYSGKSFRDYEVPLGKGTTGIGISQTLIINSRDSVIPNVSDAVGVVTHEILHAGLSFWVGLKKDIESGPSENLGPDISKYHEGIYNDSYKIQNAFLNWLEQFDNPDTVLDRMMKQQADAIKFGKEDVSKFVRDAIEMEFPKKPEDPKS